MAKKKQYRIKCVTCGNIKRWGWTNLDKAPCVCPVNPEHTVIDNSLAQFAPEVAHNLDATTNPTVTDDIDDGYVSGESKWINTETNKEFLCVDNTAGAAVWLPVRTDVFGENYDIVDSLGMNSTTNDEYQQKLKMTTPELPAGTYRIGWTFELRGAQSAKEVAARVQLDDTTDLYETVYFHSEFYKMLTSFRKVVLSNAVHEIDIDYREVAGTTCFIRGALIEIWRIS